MDLQLALLLIGTAIVAIVALTAYDKGRLTRSARRGVGAPEPPPAIVRREPIVVEEPAAPMLEGERKFLKSDEPVAVEVSAAEPDPLERQLGDIEALANQPLNLNPGFDPPGTGPEAARARGYQTLPDEALDFIMNLPGAGPVNRRSALSVYKQNEYNLEYPHELYGRRYQTNFWSIVQLDSEATQYSDLRVAIQLVAEPGPINESELNTFVQVGLKLADALHRPARFSMPFEQALDRARELQKFYDEHDVIAGVNVIAERGAPFQGTAIVDAMARVGMQLDANGIYQKRFGEHASFAVINLQKPTRFNPSEWEMFRTTGLSFQMSVPMVEEPAVMFDRMMATAVEVTACLGGKLVDQDQRPLTDKGIVAIRAQIQGIESRMRAFGIAPGSGVARRLFTVA
ncbi:MAG: cell division protein ZipA C-terminal FtsZ-binding domain-containing protein [Sulfurifustaceae bacterium]